MRVTLNEKPWYGNTTFDIDFPLDWDVTVHPMAGEKDIPLSLGQIDEAIQSPVGASKLIDMAQGKKRAVIVFDDMTRPTRVYEIAPIVVRELLKAGLEEDQITFVCALGTHGALSMVDFRKKLGSEIIERFRVYNHNIYENCIEIGTTQRGTKMMVNREFAEADLKIGIGCVTAHVQAGYSGGGKLILPGISHIDSISHYHLEVEAQGKETTGMGCHHNNILREEIDEAASFAGLDFLINVVVNGRGETTQLFCGDMLTAHGKAVDVAKEIYATPSIPHDKHIAVVNAFSKPNEMAIAILLGIQTLENASGSVVVMADTPEGQVVHYLLGRFGTGYGGRQYPVASLPDSVQLIIVTEYPDRTLADWFANPDRCIFKRNWQETLELLQETHGPGSRVAVMPNATMQYFPNS